MQVSAQQLLRDHWGWGWSRIGGRHGQAKDDGDDSKNNRDNKKAAEIPTKFC